MFSQTIRTRRPMIAPRKPSLPPSQSDAKTSPFGNKPKPPSATAMPTYPRYTKCRITQTKYAGSFALQGGVMRRLFQLRKLQSGTVYKHTRTRTNANAQTERDAHTDALVNITTPTRTHARMHTHTHTHTHARTHMHAHTYSHAQKNTRTQTGRQTDRLTERLTERQPHSYTHSQTHTHTHTRTHANVTAYALPQYISGKWREFDHQHVKTNACTHAIGLRKYLPIGIKYSPRNQPLKRHIHTACGSPTPLCV